MISVSFKFLAGRYHATPWGRHVNEGAVEWPPSPWRILRALVATWKRTLPDVAESDVKPILEILAAQPPEFELPLASTGHTRHYMPWHKGWKPDAPEKAKTLVFDTFVAVAREPNETGGGWRPAPLVARWPSACLDDAQRKTLNRILANLNTLGRSESWCEAALLPDGEKTPDTVLTGSEPRPSGSGPFDPAQKTSMGTRLSRPLNGSDPPPNTEIVRLLCPDPAIAFGSQHYFEDREKKRRTKVVKEHVRTADQYDPDWHLCAETLWLHKERWSDPPGSRWVQYTRPRDCFKIEPKRAVSFSSRGRASVRIQVARYALDSTVLPLVTETLPVAEAARRAMMSIHGRLTEHNGVRGRSPVLSGKDQDGNPLTGHGHAYYLPTDEDADGRLDHLTIFARDGFGPDERRALDRLRQLNTGRKGEERHPLRLLLLGMGARDEYGPGPLQASQVWVSATPYVATRVPRDHGKHKDDLRFWRRRTDEEIAEAREKGIHLRRLVFADRAGFLEADLRDQIRAVLTDLPDGAHAEIQINPEVDDHGVFRLRTRHDRRDLRPIQFKRFRRKPGDDGGRRLAGAFRMEFPSEIRGPVTLGHSAHFGLGLFVPE